MSELHFPPVSLGQGKDFRSGDSMPSIAVQAETFVEVARLTRLPSIICLLTAFEERDNRE